LIMFGGLAGLEPAVEADQQLLTAPTDTHTLFDLWLNTCPSQGSRTIRTEEAILISLSILRPLLQQQQHQPTQDSEKQPSSSLEPELH